MTRIAVSLILTAAVCYLSFNIGRRWEAYSIRNSLHENGTATAQYGDVAKIKITGTAEEIGEKP